MVGVIGLAVMLMLMFLHMPIGFAMLLTGAAGIGVLTAMNTGVAILGTSPFSTTSTYMFIVLPLFTLMGLMAYHGELTSELFDSARKLFGHLPGGLALAVLFFDALFAAITGESLAASIIMSKIALPEMRKYRYDMKLATGAIAVGGTLGPLIPPSAGFILYGMITETNIGALFIAGILPGILVTFLLMVTVVIWVRVSPSAGGRTPAFSWRERLSSLTIVWPIVLVFVLVIGGIYLGVFTPIEGGAIGVFVVFLIVLIRRKLTKKGMVTALKDTMQTTGMVFTILIGCFVFNYFMALSRLPMELADLALAMQINPYLVFVFVVLVLLVLGCCMDVPAMIVLTMPIFFPVVMAVGFDPIWFGVVSVIMSEVAFITPPVGMNVYVVAGTAPEIPIATIFKGIMPYLGALVVALILMTVFPQICTFLPSMMK
jgi:tripartite ATP-independent transporter DctM subunit